MHSDRVFLFSDRTENPDRFFQGYFLRDADYVFGEEGFDAYSRERGLDRLEREDGCYVHAGKQPDGCYRFSTDYSGYKKLFYFRDNGSWVVSNSLARVAEHMRHHGFRVRADESQLAAMATEGTFYPSGRGSFFSQATSFDTIVRGVRLVPADCTLLIGPSGVRLEKALHPSPDDDYRDRLERFIAAWTGRLNTLIGEPRVQVSCDLTGGLDSRTVFALLLGAARNCEPGTANALQIRSSMERSARKDFAVASGLCRRFALSLNERLRRRPIWLNGKTSYALWKDLCLGVYHPIYFPTTFPAGEIVRLGGSGGENHRPFYGRFLGAPAADRFVASRARDLALRPARPGFEAALQQAVDSIVDDSPDWLDIMACHYRHFRNRFHGGREPQYTPTFQPLASKLLDSVTAAAGASRFRNAQMHYDILHNLDPGLLDVPFDNRRKRPGRAVRRNLTSVSVGQCPSGTCFVGNVHAPAEQTRKANKTPGALEYLHGEFDRAKSGFASDFLGAAYLRRAERALLEAAERGRFSSPVRSKRVAAVMACALFDR